MNSTAIRRTLAAGTILAFGGFAFAGGVQVDPKLANYTSVPGVSGTIKSVGSDTMLNLATRWNEGFNKFYPSVHTEVEGKGSATAVPALVEGTATFGPMSRNMKPEESDNFEKKYGYKATALPTAIDLLCVFVHKDNPLANLTFPQIDAIFSKTRKGGFEKDIQTWGDLGLTGDWANKPIALYGRNAASGTYGYFKEHALFKGDYKDSVKEQPGSSAVVQGVATDRYGIGYSGIGYVTPDVRAIPLALKPGGKFVEPKPENAYSNEYPLARFLNLYVNYAPGSKLDPLRAEYIRYVFSKQGQEDAVRAEFFPVPSAIADRALASVGLLPSGKP